MTMKTQRSISLDHILMLDIDKQGNVRKRLPKLDDEHADAIAKRFQNWPQAAMVYFGILVSPCKVVIEEPEATVLVVKDHVLGTNDCRGWIRHSLFTKLGLAENCFYQFRVAFHETQAKGSFKVM